jgi:hypothetical protein
MKKLISILVENIEDSGNEVTDILSLRNTITSSSMESSPMYFQE